jgi:membrane protease YdiL (CAAX protease family)
MTHFIKQHAFVLFSALTVVLSFAAYLLPLPREAVPVVMVFVPALVAVVLTALSEGWPGVKALLSRLAQWRLRWQWVLLALGLALLLRLTISVVAVGLGVIDTIQIRAGGPALIILAVVLFVFAVPEELGWRGYALPRLLQSRSPLAAGLIIGGLWGSLHLALHLPGMMYAGLPPLSTLPLMIAISVLITWLYVRTNGNLVIATLFHAAQSFFVIFNDGIPPVEQAWLMAGVYAAVAVVVAVFGRGVGQPVPVPIATPNLP